MDTNAKTPEKMNDQTILSSSQIKENVKCLIDAEIGDDVKALVKVKDMLANALQEKKRLEQQVGNA